MDIKHTHQTRPPKTWLILWDEIEESEKSRVNWTQGSQLLSYNHQAPSTSTIQSSISTAHTMWTGGTECFSGQFSMELFHLCAVYSSLASYPGHVVRGLGTRLTPHWMLQLPIQYGDISNHTFVLFAPQWMLQRLHTSEVYLFSLSLSPERGYAVHCMMWTYTGSNTSGNEVKKLHTNLSLCEKLLSGFFLTVLAPWSWTPDWPLWSPVTLGTPVSPSVSMATTLASGPLSADCKDSGTTKASSFCSLASVLTIW